MVSTACDARSRPISTAKQDQRWTLDHLGNWSQNRFDLNGDGDFTDAEELDELRDHNAVNEILVRQPPA